MNEVIVSSAGKVLLAGGYLVLDHNHPGLVFALSSRIFIHISTAKSKDIVVQSLQFPGALWRYRSVSSNVEDISDGPKNTYILHTLQTVFRYLQIKDVRAGFLINIWADDDYYSKVDGVGQMTTRFKSFPLALAEMPKTGLGSSAALITSLTGALYIYLAQTQLTDAAKSIIHNLSQIAHCLAQGKVGSGFDIAAAVYGSCIYQRFHPAILDSVDMMHNLKELAESKWEMHINSITLPRNIEVFMGDVTRGSATPGMVVQVLKYKDNGGTESLKLWERLGNDNKKLIEILQKLNALEDGAEDYDAAFDAYVGDRFHDSETFRCIGELKELFSGIRQDLRTLGVRANVPIEPPSQSPILDETSCVPGVVGVGVPGAGGFDALFCVMILRQERDYQIEELRQIWQMNGVHMLNANEEKEGIQIVDIEEAKSFFTLL